MKNAHVICAAAQAGEQKNLPRNLSHFCALGTTAPGEGSPCAPGLKGEAITETQTSLSVLHRSGHSHFKAALATELL